MAKVPTRIDPSSWFGKFERRIQWVFSDALISHRPLLDETEEKAEANEML
jgi:hypothetical protein